MEQNLLGNETSPYLRQHADNPVHWRPWGPDALALARAGNRPILLSVGYSACHWCHVMAHESFENAEIAALMNARFVNIKVDREERPDIDAIYQGALALLGQQGGWPLTMFLTPAGQPFWGGTYFPPSARYGRPGFPDVLRSISEVFAAEPDKIAHNTDHLGRAMAGLSASTPGDIGEAETDAVAAKILTTIDATHGGLSGAPKFPQVPLLGLLWRAWRRRGDRRYRDAVVATLEKMCQGGIYDHLGGGFARYATDEAWLVPHFEKMLYDNAQLIDLMALVWRQTDIPIFAQRVAETIDWVLREMRAPDGGFASALDADSEGEEGRFYVWEAAEIDRILGHAAPHFREIYDVGANGNWEGKTILNRSASGAARDPETESGLAAARARLLEHRDQRPRPGRDDKVLADWNGLLIAALARAAMLFDRDDWLTAAREGYTFIRDTLGAPRGRLVHSYCRGRRGEAAMLDDYANMAQAALALHEATGEADYLVHAQAWVAITDGHYWDDGNGGYYFTADDGETLITRSKSAHDAATPSGNGLMIEVLARLHHLTGDAAYRRRAERVVTAFGGDLDRAYPAMGTLVNAAELLRSATQIVIVADAGDSHALALRAVADRLAAPNHVLIRVAAADKLPAGHPAFAKTAIAGRATAFVCHGQTCSAPVTDAAALAALLA